MKIGPGNALPTFTREPAKTSKTTGSGESKPIPPGLARVQARMQSVPATDRNNGQATALDRISRNIAQYAETQAIIPPPTTPPPTVDSMHTMPAEPPATMSSTSNPTPEAPAIQA
jgi:hypothetical protein